MNLVRKSWATSKPWMRSAVYAWRGHRGPFSMWCPTMLSAWEIDYLHHIAQADYSGAGAIIDAGCFLGGSTVALAAGLAKNPHLPLTRKRKRVHSYDLFVTDEYASRVFLPHLEIGASILSIFRSNTWPYAFFVKAYPGDIRQAAWNGPIEILFVDILKTPSTNDHFVKTFFPHLLPGISTIIQQDYFHEWLPWIHVSMEALSDHFELSTVAPVNSAIFSVSRAIPAGIVSRGLYESLSGPERLQLIDRGIQRIASPAHRSLVSLAKARLLGDLGDLPGASRHLDQWLNEFGDLPGAHDAAARMRRFVSA